MPSRQDASQRRRKSAGDRQDRTDVSKRVPLEQYFISDFILMAIHQNHNEVVVEGGPGTDRSSALGSSENPGTGTGWIVPKSVAPHGPRLHAEGARGSTRFGHREMGDIGGRSTGDWASSETRELGRLLLGTYDV